jgi:hypothetical protein
MQKGIDVSLKKVSVLRFDDFSEAFAVISKHGNYAVVDCIR